MTAKLLTSALFAGLVAGLIAVLLQLTLVEPLILEGEAYETGAKVHFAGSTAGDGASAAGHDHGSHDHGAASADGGEAEDLTARLTLAFFADFVIFVGWGLILVAGFALAERFGQRVTLKNALLWGGAGFVAVHMAPGIGLPPELPGTPAADITLRQVWWAFTAVSTASALACFAFGRSPLFIALGAGLLIAPHLIGAPHLDAYFGVAPPELSGEYVARTQAVGLTAWIILGLAAGYFWNRQPDAAAN